MIHKTDRGEVVSKLLFIPNPGEDRGWTRDVWHEKWRAARIMSTLIAPKIERVHARALADLMLYGVCNLEAICREECL